jgi:hypothetical protein
MTRYLLTTGLALAALVLSPAVAGAADRHRVEISNLRSGLRADVMWASTNPGQMVFLWPDTRSRSQEFDLLDVGGGHFLIRARHSRQCLGLDRRPQLVGNGTAITQERCNRSWRSSHWRRGWVGEPQQCEGDVCSSSSLALPILINRYTGKCLDARGLPPHAPRKEAVLQIWTCIRYATDANAGNQLWRFGNEAYL